MTALIWILGFGSSRGSSLTKDYYFIPSAKKSWKKKMEMGCLHLDVIYLLFIFLKEVIKIELLYMETENI